MMILVLISLTAVLALLDAPRRVSWNFLLVRKASNTVPPCSPPDWATGWGRTAGRGAGALSGSR